MSELNEDLTETKIYAKAMKLLGESDTQEFVKRGDQELKDLIALNEVHIQETTLLTHDTAAWIKATEDIKHLKDALKDALLLHRLKNKLATTVLRMRKAK